MAHTTFPSDLPVPTDDGAAAHLPGTRLPSLPLSPCTTPSTPINLATLPGTTVLFTYPRTAGPSETVPAAWNALPGARGCTPQACSFRDAHAALRAAGAAHVFGVSAQSPGYQAEVHARTGLTYALLSDEGGALRRAMRLPAFEWEGGTLLRRMAMVVRDGVVVKVFYPVFPPDRSADEVLEWMRGDEGRKALG